MFYGHVTRDVERVLRIMHDCALEPKSGRGLPSAPRVEHTGHCLEISTKTTLQNDIKINIAPNFVKCSFNYPECNEKCIRGEYIVKYTGDRKILLTFHDKSV